MTTLLQEYILGDNTLQSLVQDANALTYKTTEEIILDYFAPYKGQMLNDIANSFNVIWPTKKVPKNLIYLLVKRMLSIDGPDESGDNEAGFEKLGAEEFANGQIRIRLQRKI